jgi:hypothetical protein
VPKLDGNQMNSQAAKQRVAGSNPAGDAIADVDACELVGVAADIG